jgi:DnaD/phage-associated family protein
MRSFSGFPPGKVRTVRLPEPVFTELVPIIDDLNELKVTLHVLYLLEGQQGEARYVLHRTLLGDSALVESLEPPTRKALEAALARGVERGTLLWTETDLGDRPEAVYFANTARGRGILEALRRGEPLAQLSPVPRPNAFVLYESNIGPLTPLISDELKEAEDLYPADWIEEAFREAVALNKRSWKYIRAILKRWHSEGKQDETTRRDHEGGRRYIEGKYGDYIEY